MVLVAAVWLIRILQYSQPEDFLFASIENSKEFSAVQEVDIQKKLHKHMRGIGGNIPLAAHDQPYLFSVTQVSHIIMDICIKNYDR